jgi:diguanylate cyclase (GGDEF)-like protein
MPVVLIDVLSGLILVAAGALAGWWLRGSRVRQESGLARSERRQAREALTRIHDLAGRVAADVGQHNTRVEEINQGLTSSELGVSDDVMLAVQGLLEANSKMQEQLDSAQQKLDEQAQELQSQAVAARTDALTQLPNRRAFDAELEHGLAEYARRGKVFSLMMIDVDHFKQFNDQHGHQAGDEVLRSVASVLRANVRPTDMPSRYGGEEFAVVMPDTSAADARPLVEQIRRLIDDHRCRFGDDTFHVTVSVGMAQLGPGDSSAEVIERADEALYAAKEAGRNCAFWHNGQQPRRISPSPAAKRRAAKKPAAEAPQKPTVAEQPAPSPTPPRTESAAAPRKPEPAEAVDDQPEPATGAVDPCLATGGGEPAGRAADQPNHLSKVEDEPQAAAETWKPGPRDDQEAEEADVQGKRAAQLAPYSRTGLCTALHRVLQDWPDMTTPPTVVLVAIDNHAELLQQRTQQVGNLVLHATLQFLTAACRNVGLVAHYDEATFAMLFPNSEQGYVVNMADRLRQAIAKCVLPINQEQVQFTISLGGARAKPGDDTEKLLRRTEEALDAAVKSGGNACFFHNGQWCETVSAALARVE